MTPDSQAPEPNSEPAPGSQHYRAFIGPYQNYDRVAAMQFNLLTYLGLRERHSLLDIGCGSLRAGKLFIPYLLPGNYYGIEPEQWLLDAGIRHEIGQHQIDLKRPVLINDRGFNLGVFERQFDYLLAQSIFSHTSQAQIRHCLAEARQVMTPTSVFVATYLKGDSDYDGDSWVYPDCIPYTEATFGRLAAEQGLICQPLPWTHPNQQSWVLLVRSDYAGEARALVEQTPFLRAELEESRRQLAQLERHPYVRFGRAVKRLWRRARSARGG